MQIRKGEKTALIIGAESPVGTSCLQLLLTSNAYQKVISFSTVPLTISHSRLEHHIINLDTLGSIEHLVKGHDLFCCLEKSISSAGSKEAFRKINFDFNLQFIKIAAANQVNQILLVSTMGADKHASLFYNRVKGQLEDAIRALNFWAIHILQPSVLSTKEIKRIPSSSFLSLLARGVDNLFGGLLSKLKPIQALDVARAMVILAQQLEGGVFVYSSSDIEDIVE